MELLPFILFDDNDNPSLNNLFEITFDIFDNNIGGFDREFVLKIETIRITSIVEILFYVPFKLQSNVSKDDNSNNELAVFEEDVFTKENNHAASDPLNWLKSSFKNNQQLLYGCHIIETYN